MSDAIRVGVSACLLGEPVRHDGSHRRNAFLTEELSRYLRFVPFCPEVEAGLGVPRRTLRLVAQDGRAPRVVEPATGEDRSDILAHTAAELAARAASLDLAGFVLKGGSPSCGLERVRVYGPKGIPQKVGSGVFARALAERLPLLPLEEEGRLCDARLRESFLLRVYTRHRFTTWVLREPSVPALMRFHRAHKLVLLAHDEARARAMGRLVAATRKEHLDDDIVRYEEELFAALRVPASHERQQNALHHAAGCLKDQLDASDRQQLHDVIVAHGRGEVPLIVPLTLLRVFQARCHSAWLEEQVYLEPHPRDLGLHNSI